MKFNLLFCLVGTLVLVSCGSEQASEPSIYNGYRAPRGQFKAVGRLTKPNGSCTSTIVEKNVLLSAWHCVEDVSPRRITVRFDDESGHYRAVTMKKLRGDAVLIKFDRNFQQKPMPVSFVRFDEIVDSSNSVVDGNPNAALLVGYGQGSRYGRNKQLGVLEYKDSGGVYARTAGTFVPMASHNNQTSCPGDSGGPLLIYVDGAYSLIGALRGSNRTNGCGTATHSIFESLAAQREYYEDALFDLDYED